MNLTRLMPIYIIHSRLCKKEKLVMKSVFGRSAIPEWNARPVAAPPHYRLQIRAWRRHRYNSIGKSELFDESGWRVFPLSER